MTPRISFANYYTDVVLDAFDSSDFVINDKTVTLCRNESSSEELMPEDGNAALSVNNLLLIASNNRRSLVFNWFRSIYRILSGQRFDHGHALL